METIKYIPVLQTEELGEDHGMPTLNHSIACQNIGYLLGQFRKHVSVHQQLNLNLDGWQSIPDICAYPRELIHPDWMADQEELTIPPALVIEVLSPKQALQSLLDKVRRYLQSGVNACWVVIPGASTIGVYPQSGPSHSVSEGIVRDENLGIEIPVEEIFSLD